MRNSGKGWINVCVVCVVLLYSFCQCQVQLSLVRFVIAAAVEREGELEERGDLRIIYRMLPR